MRIEIGIAGDQQVNRDLLRFAGRIEDASPAFQRIADDLRDVERRQFDSQGRFASGGWARLSPATVARKQASDDPRVHANANTILQATGDLMRSLTSASDSGHVEIVQPHQLVFGTTVEYAAYHQLGRGVPRRRELELRERDRRDMVRTLQRFMVGSLDGAAERGLT